MKIKDLARVCRSKNAGPFYLTLDILFENNEDYLKVKKSKVFNAALISKLYRVPPETVRIFESDSAMAVKATIPRHIVSGGPYDTDVFGAQQHAPLLEIEIPM
jgi:hypothetical protein